jgi:hypothetical protein
MSSQSRLAARLAKCDFSIPMTAEEREWLDAPTVGNERYWDISSKKKPMTDAELLADMDKPSRRCNHQRAETAIREHMQSSAALRLWARLRELADAAGCTDE